MAKSDRDKRYYLKNREAILSRKKEKYQERKGYGLCVNCGNMAGIKPNGELYVYCPVCREVRADYPSHNRGEISHVQ